MGETFPYHQYEDVSNCTSFSTQIVSLIKDHILDCLKGSLGEK